jgi:cell division septal protein FtsQ
MRGVFVWILVMMAVGSAAIIFRGLTGSQFFAVKEIALEGNTRTSREELLALVEDKTRANLWKLDLEEIRKALKRNAWVRDAEVTRQLPDKLRVKINEREPYALLRRSDNSVVWIDRDGTVLGDHSRFNREIVPPVISGLAEGVTSKVQEANQRHLDLYQQLLAELDGQKPPLSPQVDEVIFDGGDGLKLRVHEGRVAVLVGTKDFRKRLEEALRILEAVERKDISALQLMKISDAERLLSGKPIAYINTTVPGRAIVGLAE